jgi:ketosteroid isomerase-like protein
MILRYQIGRVLLLLICVALSVTSVANTAQIDDKQAAVSAVLSDLHASASDADYDCYFSHFATNAVFFGTAMNERWPLADFKKYTKARFNNKNGWTYHSLSRHIYFSDDGQTAWFDEKLHHAKYGNCRSTGVLVLEQGQWKLVQYNLSIPIPDQLTNNITTQIQQYEQHH